MRSPILSFTLFYFISLLILLCECGVSKKDPGFHDKYKDVQPGTPIIIGLKSHNLSIKYAGKELVKYFNLMADNPYAATVANDPASLYFSPDESIGSVHLELGLFSDFKIKFDEIEDPELDDAIYINVKGSRGIIAGSNPRSVLFAVYRFLEANGCRWIRPGPDGDYVPKKQINNLSLQLSDKAKYRFRGHANAGSYSIDYIISKIEWSAKLGLNTYFNEFLIPKQFFQLWYSRNNCPLTDTEVISFNERLVKEIKLRGLFLHSAGHGWNGLFFGNPEVECDHWGEMIVPEDQTQYLSLVNGERVIDGPTKTELCYGNPIVRDRLVYLISDYAESHPEIDFLHFWLDDRMNNTCECELCRDKRVSDYYVKLLNEIDKELTRRKISTRIVFLVYTDLLWPPEEEKIINQDRFTLMFAPAGRLYDNPYALPDSNIVLPAYQLNKNILPKDIRESIKYLQEWQELFHGPGFVFDYHMYYVHFYDQGYYSFLKLLAEDIRKLPSLKLDGFISCQMQRTFFPHGLPHFAHARLLWNPDTNIDELANYYFEASFGEEWAEALNYMKNLSDLFNHQYFYRVKGKVAADNIEGRDAREKLMLVDDAVKKFRPVILRNIEKGDAVHQMSWKYLLIHSGMVPLLADALQARNKSGHSGSETVIAWEKLNKYIIENEHLTEGVFDVPYFKRIFGIPN